jgi:cell division protein FtsQ
MTMMDSRVADRRRGVSEDRARKRLTWILVVLVTLLVGGAAIWLVRSPLLSIGTVEITGTAMSDPQAVITELDMGVGRPTIDVDAGLLERRILEDPWVADVAVSVVWPTTLVVDVTEHVPVAPIQSGNGWLLASIDGAVVSRAPAPDPDDALVAIDSPGIAPGDRSTDPAVIGALEFIDAMPGDLRVGMRVRRDADGLVADVAGHLVILGRPREMASKAAVFEGLVASGIEPGSTINIVAPSRPAIANPQPQPEVEE